VNDYQLGYELARYTISNESPIRDKKYKNLKTKKKKNY